MYDHIHCRETPRNTAKYVSIPRTVRTLFLDLDVGIRENNGHSVTREFRHVMCFPAQTELSRSVKRTHGGVHCRQS